MWSVSERPSQHIHNDHMHDPALLSETCTPLFHELAVTHFLSSHSQSSMEHLGLALSVRSWVGEIAMGAELLLRGCERTEFLIDQPRRRVPCTAVRDDVMRAKRHVGAAEQYR